MFWAKLLSSKADLNTPLAVGKPSEFYMILYAPLVSQVSNEYTLPWMQRYFLKHCIYLKAFHAAHRWLLLLP